MMLILKYRQIFLQKHLLIFELNVKIQAIHTVGPGDIMRKVAEKYGVSKQAIMDANHKKDDITLRGEVLIITLKK